MLTNDLRKNESVLNSSKRPLAGYRILLAEDEGGHRARVGTNVGGFRLRRSRSAG